MPEKHLFTGLLMLFFFLGFAQRSELRGKIIGNTSDLDGVYIINLNSNQATTSENSGYFKIAAQVNDTLQFSAVHVKGRKVVLKAADMATDLFFVSLELASYNLNEVVINKNNMNAVTMGILSAPAKKYTPAERRLYTATGGGNTYGLNTKVSFDGILNSISGRTTMLKKEVAVERKEHTIRKLSEWFEDSFYIEKLKIPADYIKGFQYYLAENMRFESAVKSKNKTLATFIMGELAGNYLKVINEK